MHETQAAGAIVTMLCSGAAVYIGLEGLSTWKGQIKGREEYDLARRVLRGALRVRDAVAIARNPVESGSEERGARAEIVRARGVDYTIEKEDLRLTVAALRWNKVASVVRDLRVELVEAEVLWGRAAVEPMKNLDDCLWTLRRAMLARYPEALSGLAIAPEELENQRKQRSIAISFEPVDMISVWMDQVVNDFEVQMRPHLLISRY